MNCRKCCSGVNTSKRWSYREGWRVCCWFPIKSSQSWLQSILLLQSEKLDSMSCLAYMAPSAALILLALLPVMEPSSLVVMTSLLTGGWHRSALLVASCCVAFLAQYFNLLLTQQTCALSVQVRRMMQSRMIAIPGCILPISIDICPEIPLEDSCFLPRFHSKPRSFLEQANRCLIFR